jgi:ABC-2 type transport system permease protein
VFGLLIAGSGKSFADALQKSPDLLRLLQQVFPRFELGGSGGFLQLMFLEFGFILAGLAAATLTANWTSDETSGRLEMVMATPLARMRWVVSGALGILVGIAVFVVLAAVGIAIGASITGGDVATPLAGTLVLGLYATALAGIGVAVGGLVSTGAAAPAVAILTILIWLIDIIAPPLGLPDAIQQLALTAHYGQPMLGVWDPAGIVASLVLAVAGVAMGAWGFARRDLRG